MSRIVLLVCAVLAAALAGQANASIQASDVIVLFNSSTAADGYDWSVSREIADAYTQSRNLDQSQEIGVCWPNAGNSSPRATSRGTSSTIGPVTPACFPNSPSAGPSMSTTHAPQRRT